MVLHERSEIKEVPTSVFVRRALWEQAVIAYGRCFLSGSRIQLPARFIDDLSEEAKRVHRAVLEWRAKHVAHRVGSLFEKVEVGLIYFAPDEDADKVEIRVETQAGPPDPELPRKLEELTQALRNRLWATYFPTLEAELVARYRGDQQLRARSIVDMDEMSSTKERVIYTLNPTGEHS
jgi:hypothetical protein